MIGLSDKSLLHIYTLAYHYFQQDKHDDSLAVFTVLVLFNPGISDFWNGLGLCYQAKENWEKALESFVMARTTNPTNMLPKLSLIECYWHLQKIIEAKEELEIVTEIREKDPHLYEKWSADIERLTTILKKAII